MHDIETALLLPRGAQPTCEVCYTALSIGWRGCRYVDETDAYAEPIQRFAKWLPEDHEDYDSNASNSDDEGADSDDDLSDSIASMQPRVSSPARQQTARRSAPAVAPKTPSPSKPARASLSASGVQQRKRARDSD